MNCMAGNLDPHYQKMFHFYRPLFISGSSQRMRCMSRMIVGARTRYVAPAPQVGGAQIPGHVNVRVLISSAMTVRYLQVGLL